MSTITGATAILTAQRLLAVNSRTLFGSLERLATGQRINRAADDPSGLIASENLRAALGGLEAQARSLQRTDQVANVADGGLAAASDLLIEANGLAIQAANTAGMSDEERQALQVEMDSILAAVNDITTDTTFNGDALLDGTQTLEAGGQSIALPAVSTGDLGEVEVDGETCTLADLGSGGALNLEDGDVAGAQQAIQQALTDVSTARGRIGAFQKDAVGAGLDSLGDAIINLTAADSIIRDVNYAAETALFSQSLVLQQATLAAVGLFASAPLSVLDLLKP